MSKTTAISDIIRVIQQAAPGLNLSELEGRAIAEALMGFRRHKYLASGFKNAPHSPVGKREDLAKQLLDRIAKRPSRKDKEILDLLGPSSKQLGNLANRITGDLFDSPQGNYYERMGRSAVKNLLKQAKRGEPVQDRGVPSLIDLLTNPNVR